MKFKRGLLIVFLLLAVITIGSVSAADALADAEDGIDSESLSEIESAPISSSESEIIGEADNGTFTALQNKINNAEDGSTITLNNDYVYDDGFDTRGIRIAKSMTIDGNNHVIDAKSQSKIF